MSDDLFSHFRRDGAETASLILDLRATVERCRALRALIARQRAALCVAQHRLRATVREQLAWAETSRCVAAHSDAEGNDTWSEGVEVSKGGTGPFVSGRMW